MKFSFRLTLLSCIVFLLLSVFAVIWLSASRGLESSVLVMAESLSSEALTRVESETRTQLDGAKAANQLLKYRIFSHEEKLNRPLTEADLPELTSYLRDVIRVYPHLSFVSVSLAPSGGYAHVQRVGAELHAVVMSAPQNGVARQAYYRFNGARRVFVRADPRHRYDPRTRPFYRQAVAAQSAVWTDTYLFVEPNGVSYPGLSLAAPVYSRGKLAAVVTSDFSSASLCRFLQGVRVGKSGYAFVTDDRADGSTLLAAHPREEELLQKRGKRIEIARITPERDPVLSQLLTWAQSREKRSEKTQHTGSLSASGREYFASYSRLEGTPDPGLSVGLVVPAVELIGPLERHQRIIKAAAVGALIVGLLLGWLISLAVTRPLGIATRQLREAGDLHLDSPPAPGSSLVEVNDLVDGVNSLKHGLKTYSRYAPADLVRRLLANGSNVHIGGEARFLSIHFCDLVGFTALAKQLSPDKQVELLSECLTELSEEILLSGGTIDKYTGDNIMAFWGAPEPQDDQALRACRAMLHNCERLERLNERLSSRDLPLLSAQMSLHSGEAVVGNVGSESRLNYTVLGESVGGACQLLTLNRLYRTQILISEATRVAVGGVLLARPVDRVELTEGHWSVIHEPLGLRDQVDALELRRLENLIELSERAFAEYCAGGFAQARTYYEEILALDSTDGVASVMKARCESSMKIPFPASWNRVEETAKL